MAETLYKLEPHRTMQLRGFDDFGASAALTQATATGFTVSGTFRDPADFAVLIVWDADDFFGHPRFKYLPDFAFDGMALQFDVQYGAWQPLDTVKFPVIDNTFLDVVRADGTTARIPLFDNAVLQGGSFAAARGSFTVIDNGIALGDTLTLWYLNNAFQFVATAPQAPIAFLASGVAGAGHSVTWLNSGTGATATYGYNEVIGETNTSLAVAMLALINAAGGPIEAAQGTPANQLEIGVRPGVSGSFQITSTDSLVSQTVVAPGANGAAAAVAALVNGTDWTTQGPSLAIRATAVDATVTVAAARYGRVNTVGKAVTLASGLSFTGMIAGASIDIAGVTRTVFSIQSANQLTLTQDAGNLTGAPYLAERGGADGNMITLYATVSGNVGVSNPTIPLSGASSAATWRITLDFSALGVPQIRQAWMTFAPQLANGAAYLDTEWSAVFANWNVVSDPNGRRALQVAGPGSVRVEESSAWCAFQGSSWVRLNSNQAVNQADGFFSQGFVRRGSTVGDSVTIRYACGFEHDLYLGTSLYKDRGMASVSLDGDLATQLDCYLNNEPPVTARRRLRAGVAAGEHSVELTIQALSNPASAGTYVYVDFLEAAVGSAVPAPLPARTAVSAALDYDTDHSYKLPPARILWMMDQLGLAGPMNEYAGVFWWSQRKRQGATVAALTLTFSGSWNTSDQIFLDIGAPALSTFTTVGKTVFAGDSNTLIAAHFAYFINATFTGVWAQASGAVLTITVRSPTPAYNFGHKVRAVTASTGRVAELGSLLGSVAGTWFVDPAQRPTLTRAARDWHADLFNECAARGREITTSFSMELCFPPDAPGQVYSARYPDQTAVATATGFGSVVSTHCCFTAAMLAYQQRVFVDMANLQAAAGVPVVLQVGEFVWWYFAGGTAPKGMAYYDAETAAAAVASLGRPLWAGFQTPNDDPTQHQADADFLRSRLVGHIQAIRSFLRVAYPAAVLEILLPLDVNYPTVYGPFALGGRLNFYLNIPAAYNSPAAAPFDRIKMEGLDFGAGSRDLGKALRAARFPIDELQWPAALCRYLIADFNGGCPWQREELQTIAQGLAGFQFWAWDHICLFGWDTGEPDLAGLALLG